METLENIYKESFFCRRYKLHWRAEHVCKAIMYTISPISVIDVGCATGDLVLGFGEYNIFSKGLEGAKTVSKYLVIPESDVAFRDLRVPMYSAPFLPIPLKYDLAMCLEVVEHIEIEFADILVENLCVMGDKILLSAAPPGQGGHHHVNCQHPEYWDKKFLRGNYKRNQEVAEKVKYYLLPWKHKPGIKAFYQNMLYYEKGG